MGRSAEHGEHGSGEGALWSAPLTEAQAERPKERIYATITIVAALMGLARFPDISHTDAALVVAITAAGLWGAMFTTGRRSTGAPAEPVPKARTGAAWSTSPPRRCRRPSRRR